ncbi:hypothetical protein V6N12_015357 [Hibiscus sabdariffa]|uniref:Uncharacterized protein n=1 Tax=Hibiscus sabdariffa TaxID=183260 RepID=A0ABR2DMX3_9ROSI
MLAMISEVSVLSPFLGFPTDLQPQIMAHFSLHAPVQAWWRSPCLTTVREHRYHAPANSRSCYRKIDTDTVALSSIASYISNHATISRVNISEFFHCKNHGIKNHISKLRTQKREMRVL